MTASARELVLGIDFGTSTSAAAVVVDGRVQYALDGGDPSIPSLVYVPPTGPLAVGKEAMRLGYCDPFNLVSSVKRLLGLPYTHPEVRVLDAGQPYSVHPGPGGQVLIRMHGAELSPIQLVAAILARLKKLAEARFGGIARRAVFAVPAARPAGYSAALARAAKLAGLEVIAEVPEPVAGHAGQEPMAPADRLVAVLDFGGGTFDATLMEQRGMKFTSRAVGGDPWLGGDDFDDVLAKAVDGSLQRARKTSMRSDKVLWRQLVMRCESVKRQLSRSLTARLHLADRLSAGGDIDVLIERDWIEPRWRSLADRAVDVVQSLLAEARVSPDDIDDLILIGGTTLVPIVERSFSHLFGRPVVRRPDADLAVARGAAVIAARHDAAAAAAAAAA